MNDKPIKDTKNIQKDIPEMDKKPKDETPKSVKTEPNNHEEIPVASAPPEDIKSLSSFEKTVLMNQGHMIRGLNLILAILHRMSSTVREILGFVQRTLRNRVR